MKIVTVVGARPQFIKAAVLSRALGDIPEVTEVIVHTGQHFDENMSGVFFEELGMPAPGYNLKAEAATHASMTGRMLERIETVLLEEKPDGVLVYGDTNSTLAGALAAAKLHIPIFHVEAGLRSFNRLMPEEVNRVLTDHISSLLFCPTRTSVSNLESEGITAGVHLVGDVMYDATLYAREQALRSSSILESTGLTPGEFGLCTVHRAENTDDPERFESVCRYIETQAEKMPLVMPLHPRTRKILQAAGRTLEGVTQIDPVGYLDMHALLAGSVQVMTDSGGLQKEAYFHQTPCITLRDETEWVETIDCGWNRLWTTESYMERKPISDYGVGKACDVILQKLDEWHSGMRKGHSA